MRRIKLTKQERAIENALLSKEYVDVPRKEFDLIAQSIASRKKDAVLNIRVNSGDLTSIKAKAKKFGIRYQTFLSELIHRVAHDNLARN
jgi:predicted DNA binding CopG/RHH family protein